MMQNYNRCRNATAWLRQEPYAGITIEKNETQLLCGEGFVVSELHGDWAYGHSLEDGYKGYVHFDDLAKVKSEPTHMANLPLTHIYPEPTFKSRPLMNLPMLGKVSVSGNIQNGFVPIEDEGWVFADHLNLVAQALASDHLSIAEMFLNAPYLYGGQTVMGIDCSGLVRVSLMAAGYNCPRDCSRQMPELPGDIDTGTRLRRGDIVYIKSHVVIMLDDRRCINATARTMKTCIEDIGDIISIYGDVLAIKRFS